METLDALAESLGPRGFLRDAQDLAPYAEDWRGNYRGLPRAVLRPSSVAEVSASVRACAVVTEHRPGLFVHVENLRRHDDKTVSRQQRGSPANRAGRLEDFRK